MIIYGIPTCETVKKAMRALQAAGHDVTFRDVRENPLSPEERAEFMAAFDDSIVNRASMTWRKLSEAERARSPDALIADYPTLMKRPVIRAGDSLHLGWTKAVQGALL